jgi:hypothetical protein
VVFEKTEIPPTLYEAPAGSSLEENQVVWEKMALAIIDELAQ